MLIRGRKAPDIDRLQKRSRSASLWLGKQKRKKKDEEIDSARCADDRRLINPISVSLGSDLKSASFAASV